MEVLRWKTRIAILWVFMAVAMSTHSIITFMEPGMIEELMTGEVEGMVLCTGLLIFMELFWLIPLWMAFVTMTLKGTSNRWTNFVLGILFTLLNIWHFIGHLASPVQILIIGSTVAVAALIAWYAWKWPMQEA